MQPTSVISDPAQAAPAWLIPRSSPEPALHPGPWYESLYRHRSRAEDRSFEALRWLLNVLPCRAVVVEGQDISDAEAIAVPASDALAVAVADRAAALFILTGAFTQEQAAALVGAPHAVLLQPLAVPANVVTPAREAQSRWGTVSRGGYAWFWQQLPTNAAVLAGAVPAQGMLRAVTETEAIDRLREAFPEAGPFTWIKRRDFVFPAGLESAF